MDRKRFLYLLEKYLQGRATPQEEALIDAWYERMGRSSVDGMEGENENALEKRYLANMRRRLRAGEYRMVAWRSLRVAATILFTLAASFIIWSEASKTIVTPDTSASVDVPTPAWQRIAHEGQVTLPDGSTVTLEPQSEIVFQSGFTGTERSVWLEGEAFFDVCPDPEKPFLVHARELTTKVLGTSFSVRAFEADKDVAVAVRTGKVFVATSQDFRAGAPKKEVLLTPNQKVIYDKVQQTLARAIIEHPQIIVPVEEARKLRFEAAPVSDIFDAIEKIYGVDLVFDSTVYQSCTLTSVISDGELFKRLDIICKAIGARYELDENRIVIEGSVCNRQ